MLPAGTTAVSVLLTTCMFVQPSRAQIGSDCSDTEPCTGDQECSLGYCRCPQGFVKSSRECLPEASFNETCEVDDQCTDFRLKCVDWRCACVKYYHWDEYSRQCLTYKDLKYMLNDMNEKYHTFGELDAETSLVFTLMMWTGLAVMVIGLVLASGCIFYGCCYGRLCCCPSNKLSNTRCCS